MGLLPCLTPVQWCPAQGDWPIQGFPMAAASSLRAASGPPGRRALASPLALSWKGEAVISGGPSRQEVVGGGRLQSWTFRLWSEASKRSIVWPRHLCSANNYCQKLLPGGGRKKGGRTHRLTPAAPCPSIIAGRPGSALPWRVSNCRRVLLEKLQGRLRRPSRSCRLSDAGAGECGYSRACSTRLASGSPMGGSDRPR